MRDTLLVTMTFDSTMRTMPVSAGYRPHLALPQSDFLMGIELVSFKDEFSFDVPLHAKVRLIYDGVDYSSLSVGTKFHIREGSHIVGYGTVIKREHSA